MFHGEPTVGLQSNIPLSRRVQLAVLAHIRHTHTRYDKLLKETSWMNARKAVEPVCLDVLVKWRGDEETGRDQMDEILREVVIITDSEDEDSSDDESSEEGEVTSGSSPEAPSLPISRDQQRSFESTGHAKPLGPNGLYPVSVSSNPTASLPLRESQKLQKHKKAQRGFKRYQAAWEDALNRRQESSARPANAGTPIEDPSKRNIRSAMASPLYSGSHFKAFGQPRIRPLNNEYQHAREELPHHHSEVSTAITVSVYRCLLDNILVVHACHLAILMHIGPILFPLQTCSLIIATER